MFAQAARDTRIRPIVAFRAARQLMRTGDTRQIFILLRAMRGRSGLRMFRRFVASPTGAAVMRERRSLLATLTDHAALGQLAHGTLGRTYLAFMEGHNLSAEALVQASQNSEILAPDHALFRDRMRDLHDVTHVVTGYGRDRLGEICLLANMHAHSRNLGTLLVVAMAWPRLSSAGRRAVIEGWRNGRKASWLPGQDWEALLSRPLDLVRAELGIVAPLRYQAICPPQ